MPVYHHPMPSPDPPRSPGDDFDAMGEAYAASAESSPYNALYDRPALLELAGDVRGLHVLDAGCAAGALSAVLAARGATVVGVDASGTMIELAQKRNLERASFVVADIAEPMPFLADDSFNLVAASLVLHYDHRCATPIPRYGRS
jgi:2-polyprenyl-3-methyl-5-hydroxy-6-metoxy-1,4-benzoquinol methylase